MTEDSVKYVVFSSGALGALSLIGSWRALETLGLTKNIKGMSGCSMGSIIATLASIGYTSKEMEIVALNTRYEDYADQSILLLSEHFGLETGRKLMKLLDRLIRLKTHIRGLTFQDHWRLTGRQLWINATYVEKRSCVYYSVKTTPTMKIIDAIRQSVAVPFLFTAVRTPEGTFVDGGCYDPVPASMFPVNNTLCLNVRNSQPDPKLNGTAPSALERIDDGGLVAFSAQLLGGMFTELNVLRFKVQEQQGYRMIYIYTGIGSVALSLSTDAISSLIETGYRSVYQDFKTD